MRETIFLVGKLSPDIFPSLMEKNYRVGVFLDKDLLKEELPKGVIVVPVDFTNKETILDSIKEIKFKIDALLARYENYIVPKTWIAEALQLKATSEESALAASDKFLMREKFFEYDKSITPEFKIIKSEEDLKVFAKSHKFPLMLKPTNLVKSLLVFKNHNLKELISNYKKASKEIKEIYKKYHVKGRTPNFLIEEYLVGTKHSVAAFADNKGEIHIAEEIADLEMGEDVGLKDNFVYSRILPSKLTKDKQDKIKKVATKGMKALGLKNSPGHVEIFYTRSGPKIIEIGARVGGYRSRMYKLANGIDLDQVEIDIALGNEPDLKTKLNNYSCVIELFPSKKGKFVSIKNIDLIKNLKTLSYFSVKAEKDKISGLSKDGYKAAGLIILASPSRNLLNKDIQWIKQKVKVIVK